MSIELRKFFFIFCVAQLPVQRDIKMKFLILRNTGQGIICLVWRCSLLHNYIYYITHVTTRNIAGFYVPWLQPESSTFTIRFRLKILKMVGDPCHNDCYN